LLLFRRELAVVIAYYGSPILIIASEVGGVEDFEIMRCTDFGFQIRVSDEDVSALMRCDILITPILKEQNAFYWR
jgi:hypothetical protein